MQKRAPTPTVEDHLILKQKHRRPVAPKPSQITFCSGPAPLGKHRAINYAPSENSRKEPTDIPRLFIRGFGGSIKLDLEGVGIRLSKAVFAHQVADDSLEPLHIFRGDIVLIEPIIQSLREGNLFLLEIDGQAVLRRLVKKKRLWCLSSVDGDEVETTALADHALQGVAVGFMRIFAKLKPVRFHGTDANYSTDLERSHQKSAKRERPKNHRKQDRSNQMPKGAGCSYLPASARKTNPHLTERDEKIRYKTWPNNR